MAGAEFTGKALVKHHEHRAAQPREEDRESDRDQAQPVLLALLGLLFLLLRLLQQVCGFLLGGSRRLGRNNFGLLLSLGRLSRRCFRHRHPPQTVSVSSASSICGTTTKRYLSSAPG